MSILGHSRVPRSTRPAVSFWWVGTLFLGLSALLSSGTAAAEESTYEPPPRAPNARTGDFIDYEPRPILPRELRACSFRHPLCVHEAGGRTAPSATQGREGQAALAWLDAADRAWDAATGALGLPSPDPSPTTRALDLYIVDAREPTFTRTLLDRRDVFGGFDRASAFALVGPGARGCALDAAAGRVIAHAILFRVAPASDAGSAIAESAAIAGLIAPCTGAQDAEVSFFQAHPEVGLPDRLAPPGETFPTPALASARDGQRQTPGEAYAAGASLFYDWLDQSFGGYPGATVQALWALRPTLTPFPAERWHTEPDGFDVLRTSFKHALTTGSTVDDLWLDFAVARAFVPALPVRQEWAIEWPATPRTLLSGAGIAPTGAAYVAIDLAGRPRGARLRFEAHWEEHARMRWALVRVDANGHELSRVAVSGPDRGTDAQTTLVDLDGVARVLVVASSAGDPLVTFDPADYLWESHGWAISLAGE